MPTSIVAVVRMLPWSAIVLAVAACQGHEPATHRDASSTRAGERATVARGEAAFREHACGACHLLTSVAGAQGVVGPVLDDLRERVYIAGHLPNSEEQRARFIQRPHDVDPHTAMPAVGISTQDARAIAAFLVARR